MKERKAFKKKGKKKPKQFSTNGHAVCLLYYWSCYIMYACICYVTKEKGVHMKYCMTNSHRFKNWFASCISAP